MSVPAGIYTPAAGAQSSVVPRWSPRARIRAWFHARLPVSDTLALTQRNVYILPTRAGLMLAATLVVLLVASINYQLNLGYLLTFLLAGCTFVGMHLSHNTLRGLRLSLAMPQPQFAGAAAMLDITLANDAPRPRLGIGLAVLAAARQDGWVWCDVPPQGSASVKIAFQAARRGLYRVPELTAETRYPLGTFRVWSIWRPAAQVLVYPAPEAHPPPLPVARSASGGGLRQRLATSGEFEGVRPWRRGDTLRQVVWKKSGKSGELVSRDSEQARRQELWLDLGECGGGELEHRLSRLSAWVLQADRLGADYGLRLPGREIRPAHGEAHRLRCLEALALC